MAKFTKKHFLGVADVLKSIMPIVHPNSKLTYSHYQDMARYAQWCFTVEQFEEQFALGHPKFDKVMFRKACGYTP